MTTLAQSLEGSAIARWGSAASIAVVLAAGLVSAGVKPGERSQPRPAPHTSIVAPRQASVSNSQSTAVTALATTIPPAPAPTTTTPPRPTPPFQAVPDDPSAMVPPPVRGIDPISGD